MILWQLISNAIHFQNAPCQNNICKISIHQHADHAKISFWDNGIGIPENVLGNVFDLFYRGTDRSKGSGLGLYIVKSAVKKLKGRISVQSRFGEYTQLEIMLPNQDAPA